MKRNIRRSRQRFFFLPPFPYNHLLAAVTLLLWSVTVLCHDCCGVVDALSLQHKQSIGLRRVTRSLQVPLFVSSSSSSRPPSCLHSQSNNNSDENNDTSRRRPPPRRFVLLGGAGKIGSAVAQHILFKEPNAELILVGRNRKNGQAVVDSLIIQQQQPPAISFQAIDNLWSDDGLSQLREILRPSSSSSSSQHRVADCLIHTAGPFGETKELTFAKHLTKPLELAVECDIPVYVDVADPLPYLERCLLMNDDDDDDTNKQIKTTCLLSAGAFPGMSNVLAMEAAKSPEFGDNQVQDLFFQYFTSGLGGSGAVNLYITNVGFGEPMVQYDRGELRWFTDSLSGRLLGTVDFGLFNNDNNNDGDATTSFGLDAMNRRVGRKQVFAWPFPEAATVANELKIRGSSTACMGTAPDVWNTLMGVMVDNLVPRQWWHNLQFCQFLADFSLPLVTATDWILKQLDKEGGADSTFSSGGGGETHAMRIDVRRRDGSGVSILQAHDSFRHCVAQSCAEFALDCLDHPAANGGGVFLPEQRYRDPIARARIVSKLTTTPGTFCYSGPIAMTSIAPPTQLEQALAKADQQENDRI